MMLLNAMLSVTILAQAQPDRTMSGQVVDDQGRPIVEARVVIYAPPLTWGRANTAETRATTNAEGRFQVRIPPLGREIVNGVNLLVYQPGLAIAGFPFFRPPAKYVLRKPEPRTIKVEGPDGQPIAGARVAPRVLHISEENTADIPESLAAPLTVTTGPDGQATLNYLTARDQLVAARVTAPPTGTQDILLVERPGRSSTEPIIAIRLKKTGHLDGRIVDDVGGPVAGQPVEIWSRGGGSGLRPNVVELSGGPPRTAADGSFRTPDNLLVGSTYRVVLRGPGKETILTEWMTIGEAARTLAPIRLRSLRTIAGRVVDRQGKPVAGAEVFQSSEGPEPTSTRSGPDGRFALAGFHQRPVFLFARGDGFRFHGQLVRDRQGEVTVAMARTDESPDRPMRMLPELISTDESRAMARRLIEPVWKVVVDQGDATTRYRTLEAMASADPAGVLDRLASGKFVQKEAESRLRQRVAVALAPIDPEEAAAVAEAIPDADPRATALMAVIDALPDSQRPRRLALLDRAALDARATNDPVRRLRLIGYTAERLHDLGETAKARALFAEGLKIANELPDKTEVQRGHFAGQLVLVDRPAAMAIAREFEPLSPRQRGALMHLADRLMDTDPAEAERFWKLSMGSGFVLGTIERMCCRMASVDPARARRIVDGFSWIAREPDLYIYAALGASKRDERAAREAIREGLRLIDKQIQEEPERFQAKVGALLPVVERIDPALLSEIFWRAVVSRSPSGNPRSTSADSPSGLIDSLVWYDRDVAAVLFEPARQRIEQAEDRELATWRGEFLAWSLFDPRAAVERLEKVPVSRDKTVNANAARIAVAASLGLSYEGRWRDVWKYWAPIFAGPNRAY
jgi:hypothetical protein